MAEIKANSIVKVGPMRAKRSGRSYGYVQRILVDNTVIFEATSYDIEQLQNQIERELTKIHDVIYAIRKYRDKP